MRNKHINLDLLPTEKPIIGLLRHAERPAIPAGEWGTDLGLTSEGELSCQLLANKLKPHLTEVYSSPLKRCTQTAAILASLAKHSAVTTSQLLGDPGVFISNPALTENYFLQYSADSIAKHLLDENINPPGFCCSTPEAVLQLIDFMLNAATRPGITLFVTHDSILSIVLGYLFEDISLDTLWPDYLEGLFLWRSDELLHFTYRGIYKQSLLPL